MATPTSKISLFSKEECFVILPAKRAIPTDISTPKLEDLSNLALLRVMDAAFPMENRPPRLFPTTETIFSEYFSSAVWHAHGDMETELGRMNYLLSELAERSIPSRCNNTIRSILSSSAVLPVFREALPQLRKDAMMETDSMVAQMQGQKKQEAQKVQKSDFVTAPVNHETDIAASLLGTRLWRRALGEMTTCSSRGDFEHVPAFLQIMSYLRDPIGGLDPIPPKAVDLFISFTSCIVALSWQTESTSAHHTRWHAVMAQAAQEALFLSDPILGKFEYIHFSGHQQLPYVFVELDRLPRSEFSIPQHVLQIVEEILLSGPNTQEGCLVAPITVSTYPVLPIGCGRRTIVIIDGNHRVAATMLLRFIAEQSIADTMEGMHAALDVFCRSHNLGIKWQVDLREVIDRLWEEVHYLSLFRRNLGTVKRFRYVDRIAALVAREDNFHTVCQQRPHLAERPRLLLPIHQAIYNDEGYGFAFPRAGQVHGRAVGFKPMPLFCNESPNA